MIIKFNKIQDLGDARYAASCMAEYIGFSMQGESAFPVSAIQEIIGWCAGPKVILEVSHAEISEIESWINIIPVDGIECSKDRVNELKDHFNDIQHWLISNDDKSLSILNQDSINLVPIIPSLGSAKDIDTSQVKGINIDCIREIETGRKDYSDWNDFFEELEIF